LCAVTSRLLVSVNDDEFGLGQPLPLDAQRSLSAMLGSHLHELIWDRNVGDSRGVVDLQLATAEAKLFNQLYDRHARRDFAKLPRDHWLWPPVVSRELNEAMAGVGLGSRKVSMVLTVVPQVLPFDHRVRLFQQLIEKDKESLGIGSGSFLGGSVVHDVTIDRSSVYEDAFDQLDPLGPRLKGRVRVTFASDLGYAEAGIDGGGLFKDFMDGLTETAFDPSRGHFAATEDQLLFPSPLSAAQDVEHLKHFEFMGRVLGKAVYSGILVKPQFALPFLNKLLDRTCVIDDLFGLDPELYRHLMSLKAIAKEAPTALEDLTLAFTATAPSKGGGSHEVDLVLNGSKMVVTNANFLEYTFRLANYKLNLQTGPQSRAFLRGFRDLIPVDWIRMFDARELQMVIGGQQRALDLANLSDFTAYGGGFHPSQPVIQWFWEVLAEFSPAQQGDFLKFVTSCARQPLLGFQYMQPPFCIQKVPLDAAGHKLPTAATCMSLLKLPDYRDKATMKAKLLYAISSNAGFELS
jgi:ubiquitin-protein ligase E3 C